MFPFLFSWNNIFLPGGPQGIGMCDCNEVGFIFNEQIGSQRLCFKIIGQSHEMQDVILVEQL